MGLTNFEKKVLKDVSKKKCWNHVKWFAEKGEKLSGTAINEKSVDYILNTLKRIGVDSTAPKFDAWLGFPNNKDCMLTILEPEKRALKCVTLAQSYSTSPKGIEGELIYVKGGNLKDYQDINARNKITLVEFSKPPARPWKNYVAGILKEAIGQIVISYTGPEEVLNKGTVKSVWGNPTPETIQDIGRIPVINISAKDGMYLKNLLEKNKVKVRLRSNSERDFMKTRQPMAKIKGDTAEFVLLGSHMDAWGSAATCNALGCASTLEAARLMKKYEAYLIRGAELLWFQGHETGIMSGSTWYLDNHWENLNKNCAAYLNNDTTNMIHTNIYTVDGDPVLRRFLITTVRELAEEEGAQFKEPPNKYLPRKYGDQSFYGIGIPSVRVQTTYPPEKSKEIGPRVGWWYHSEYDTLDKCDPETLYMAEKAQTLVLLRLCTLPVLPFQIEAIADWMLDTLKQLKSKANEILSIEDLLEKTKEFKKTASQLDIETENLASRDTQDSSQLKKIKITNNCLKRINRVLNPVTYTLKGKYDQDYYGAEYVKPIPILQPMEELANIIPNTTQQKALLTKLVRAKNQVMDAVQDAACITQYSLKKLRE